MLPLTPTEAAAFTGLDEHSIRKDIEYGIVPVGSPPRFSSEVLLYFSACASFPFQLKLKDRKRLFEAIGQAQAQRQLVLGPGWVIDLALLSEQLQARIERFNSWQSRLVSDPAILGGEPVFPESRLSVRKVGELMKRGGRGEILEDYPYLQEEDLTFAHIYCLAYPRIGRPVKQLPG
jgi:uncharacterized protein (DUF433 family)